MDFLTHYGSISEWISVILFINCDELNLHIVYPFKIHWIYLFFLSSNLHMFIEVNLLIPLTIAYFLIILRSLLAVFALLLIMINLNQSEIVILVFNLNKWVTSVVGQLSQITFLKILIIGWAHFRCCFLWSVQYHLNFLIYIFDAVRYRYFILIFNLSLFLVFILIFGFHLTF